MTEVFEIKVNPLLFNWTYEDFHDQYVYQPSLLNAPDLPKWINYIYSHRHNAGFLYGVPPVIHHDQVILEIIALNKKNYETRRHVLPIFITEKRNPARNEVQMKIDNLNVEDMFEVARMDRLKDVFKRVLWKDSDDDLYVTFLESAVDLGARLPLDPKQGDGVVIRIGSTARLSNELIELQEEVRPLWKLFPCPRDLKRTTVERLFRENGFALDWCAFRLLEDTNSAMPQSSPTNYETGMSHPDYISEDDNTVQINDRFFEDQWNGVSIEELPIRSYINEFVFTIIIPVFLLTFLALVLSLILCFHHEGISKNTLATPLDHLQPYSGQHCILTQPSGIDTHVISNNVAILSESGAIDLDGSSGGGTMRRCQVRGNSSGNDKTGFMSPNASAVARGMHCRPSPPPYVKPRPSEF